MDLVQPLVVYGPYLLAALLVAAVAGLYRIGRGAPYFLPRSLAQWTGALACVVVLGGSALGLIVLATAFAPLRVAYTRVGEAPPVAFRQVDDDQPAQLRDYEGRVVLLNVWATWCGPCLREMSALDSLQQTYAADGLAVLALSDEPRDVLQAHLADHPSALTHGYVTPEAWRAGPLGGIADVRPITFVVDRTGTIRETLTGAHTFADFARAVEPYL